MYLLSVRSCCLPFVCFSIGLELQDLALQMPLSCLRGFCHLLLRAHQDAGAALSADNRLSTNQYTCKCCILVIPWLMHCQP